MIKERNEKPDRLDKIVFFSSIILLTIIATPIILFPEKSAIITTKINGFLVGNFGFYYIWFAIASIIFCVYVSLSKYGKIKMGKKDDVPEFKTFSWISMLFCAGVGGGIVYWGFIEWLYYYSTPPFGLEYGSWEAAEVAATYGAFHWGISAWSMYAVASCAVGYIIHVKGGHVLKISEACRGVLGDRVDRLPGKIIDIIFIFGLVGGIATSLGLGTPLITAAFSHIFGIADTVHLQIIVLFVITAIFAVSSYLGLEKGMQIISKANMMLTFFVILFIFFVSDAVFILKIGTTSMGYMLNNFIRMSTWLDPTGVSQSFPERWTVFFWAWWISFAPFQGMFFARISKGRTIREMVLGAIVFGSLGCFIFFAVFGNFGLSLQLSGEMDLVKSLSEVGAPKTIVKMLTSLPLGNVIIFLVSILVTLYLATTYDATSHILASNTQVSLSEDGNPKKWLRLLWAFCVSLIPLGFILISSPLLPLQTISIIFALPVSVIVILTAISFIKMVDKDIKEGNI